MNRFAYRSYSGESWNEAPSTSDNNGYTPKHRTVNHVSGGEHIPKIASRSRSSAFIPKAPPVERKLECTLEELFHGCVKNILVTRSVVGLNGKKTEEQEKLKIKVKPGWKAGTKITFEGLGDERPGTLPADLVFVIAEKHHPLYKRDGNDLVLMREVPLVKALTGCTLSDLPLIAGDQTNIVTNEIVSPGYQMIINGQGMPDAKNEGKRGDLRVEFKVTFPTHLSKEQQMEIKELLQGMPLSL